MKNLKPVLLNHDEMAELCAIMSKGNTKLHECADMFGMDKREFRGKLFNHKLDLSNLTPEQLTKLEAAVPDIMEVKVKCEKRILESFAYLVMQQAHAAARNSFDQQNTYHNFEQEAAIAVLDSIYGYTDTSIQLITYVWRAIRHRLLRASNDANPFRPLTNAALKLLKRFNEEKDKMVTSGPVTDEQVIEKLNLTDEERELILDITRKVVDDSQMTKDVVTDRDDDYTGNRRTIDMDVAEVFLERREVRQAFKDAQLDAVELDVVLAKAFPYTGWQEDVASKHINPKTNQRYTRQNVPYILERAERKIKEAMEHPAKVPVENPDIDLIFDELSGRFAK